MSSYLTDHDHITEIIPQRPPFVMIGALVQSDEKEAVTVTEVTDSNILLEDGRLSVSGMLENIAQTAAAQVGYHCKVNNTPVPVGFIGAISKTKVHGLPEAGATIRTTVNILQEVFNITLIAGKIWQDDKLLLECQMKIMVAREET